MKPIMAQNEYDLLYNFKMPPICLVSIVTVLFAAVLQLIWYGLPYVGFSTNTIVGIVEGHSSRFHNGVDKHN